MLAFQLQFRVVEINGLGPGVFPGTLLVGQFASLKPLHDILHRLSAVSPTGLFEGSTEMLLLPDVLIAKSC